MMSRGKDGGSADKPRRERDDMRRLFRASLRSRRLFSAALLFSLCLPAHADIIDFDDIDPSGGPLDMATLNPYQGLLWTRFNAYASGPFTPPGFGNGVVSPFNAAFSGGQLDTGETVVGIISAPTPFDLVSIDIGAGWYNNLNVTVQGLLGGSVLYSNTVLAQTTGAQTFVFDFAHIDTLRLFGTAFSESTDPYNCGRFNCTQFTVDNIVFAAPEPESLALLALGGAALATTRRRRTQSR